MSGCILKVLTNDSSDTSISPMLLIQYLNLMVEHSMILTS